MNGNDIGVSAKKALHSQFVYLSLGSNIGDRAANLNEAIAALPSAGVRVSKVSAFYETEPVDYLEQDWFLNCVVEGETELPGGTLLAKLREIETADGQQKEFSKGPRMLDIDILLYGDETIATPELQVPHPRMTQRRFVLVPLAEIAPYLRHPSWHGNAAELLGDDGGSQRSARVEPAGQLEKSSVRVRRQFDQSSPQIILFHGVARQFQGAGIRVDRFGLFDRVGATNRHVRRGINGSRRVFRRRRFRRRTANLSRFLRTWLRLRRDSEPHLRTGTSEEFRVERVDLAPIGFDIGVGLRVQRGDGGLQLVWADVAQV